jgi:hypothetical protein
MQCRFISRITGSNNTRKLVVIKLIRFEKTIGVVGVNPLLPPMKAARSPHS